MASYVDTWQFPDASGRSWDVKVDDLLALVNERGTKYKFRRVIVSEDGEPRFVEVFGGKPGYEKSRTFMPDRLRVHTRQVTSFRAAKKVKVSA